MGLLGNIAGKVQGLLDDAYGGTGRDLGDRLLLANLILKGQGAQAGLLGQQLDARFQAQQDRQKQEFEQRAQADEFSRLVGKAQGSYPLMNPQTGQAEQAVPADPSVLQRGLLGMRGEIGDAARATMAKGLLGQMFPEKATPVALSEGAVLVDPRTGQQIAAGNPKAPSLPPGMMAGPDGRPMWVPGYLEGRERLALAGRTPQMGPEASTGPFQGMSLDAQDSNIVLTGDPASPQYALAYARLTQPRLVQTQDGMVTVTPTLPPSIRPPSGAAQGGQAPTAQYQTGAPIPGTEPALNNEQALSRGFFDRMAAADQVLSSLGSEGTSQWGQLLNNIPGGNYLQSDDYQKFAQAKRDFINAQLRRESGAAIAASEFENADKQYFPQPGDSENVIKQKAEARQRAIANMAVMGRLKAQPTAPQTGTAPTRAFLNGRTIVPSADNSGWVYEDTGEPAR